VSVLGLAAQRFLPSVTALTKGGTGVTADVGDFECEAYGDGGREVGAVCFIAGPEQVRVCPTIEACHLVMTSQRQQLYDRIQELAAAGDETAIYLAGEFSSPGQMLGGPDAPPDQEEA
jgi:hypothetical protein